MYDSHSSEETARVVREGMARLGQRLRAERADLGLSLSRLSLLGLLLRRGPMTATAMAAAERIQPQSLTRMLSRLEEHDLIARRRDDEDRRQVLIEITDRGRKVLTEDTSRREAWLAKAMEERLTPTERELLRLCAGLMEKLADA